MEEKVMKDCKVLALCSQKGGVGKTTSCVNLAVGLAKAGKKVLVIDNDPQGSMTASLGYHNPDELPITLATILTKIVEDELFENTLGILHHQEGIDLIPANIELSGMEVSLVNIMSRELVLKQYIERMREEYDYILIDCMPSLGMLTINALASVDAVIIPVQAAYLPVKGLEQLIRTIGKVRRQLNKRLAELDRLFSSLYEDKVMERITERNFEMMSGKYQKEQLEIEARLKEVTETLNESYEKSRGIRDFLALIRNYQGLHDCERPWTMWRKVAIWTQAIYNAFNDNICEYDDEVLRSKEKEIIDRIAVVNVKKSNGGSESEYEDLKKYAIEDRLEIKRELEIIQPDIIVCGNNLSLLKLVLGEELQNDDTWDNMLALWKDTLVLDYYHPAVHYPNRVNYYALMAICDVARKKYGTPVWSEQNEKY